MKSNKRFTLFLSVFFLLLMSTVQLKAQGTPCGDPDLDCPIDGPVVFLLAVILLLSVKKISAARQNSPQTK